MRTLHMEPKFVESNQGERNSRDESWEEVGEI
jgi:hypothetical protein